MDGAYWKTVGPTSRHSALDPSLGHRYIAPVSDHSLPLSASTRLCAVYGFPVHHSASPAMQNAGIATLGLDWRYTAAEVRPKQLKEAINGARAMHYVGLNLTVPHKLLAMDMVDILDESSQEWGAVNTILFEGQRDDNQWRPIHEFDCAPQNIRSHGFNTDADGITQSLREDLGIEVRGESILLLGAGGAGRVAALKLAATGVKDLFIINRTTSKAEALVTEIQQRFPAVNVSVNYPSSEIDLVINATSLGLRDKDPSPLDPKAFCLKKSRAVYDMIYQPNQTPLLTAAKEAGCKYANGLGMLLHQGAKSLEIWSGQSAPLESMREALKKAINHG